MFIAATYTVTFYPHAKLKGGAYRTEIGMVQLKLDTIKAFDPLQFVISVE